jgi:hypothetical protein
MACVEFSLEGFCLRSSRVLHPASALAARRQQPSFTNQGCTSCRDFSLFFRSFAPLPARGRSAALLVAMDQTLVAIGGYEFALAGSHHMLLWWDPFYAGDHRMKAARKRQAAGSTSI